MQPCQYRHQAELLLARKLLACLGEVEVSLVVALQGLADFVGHEHVPLLLLLVLLEVGTDVEFQLIADLQHLGLGHHGEDGGEGDVGGPRGIFDGNRHDAGFRIQDSSFRFQVNTNWTIKSYMKFYIIIESTTT